VNWNEKGQALGIQRASGWSRYRLIRTGMSTSGYDTGVAPQFDASAWKRARGQYVRTHKASAWTKAASKCEGPTDAQTSGHADGVYCSVDAVAVELNFRVPAAKHQRQYRMCTSFRAEIREEGSHNSCGAARARVAAGNRFRGLSWSAPDISRVAGMRFPGAVAQRVRERLGSYASRFTSEGVVWTPCPLQQNPLVRRQAP